MENIPEGLDWPHLRRHFPQNLDLNVYAAKHMNPAEQAAAIARAIRTHRKVGDEHEGFAPIDPKWLHEFDEIEHAYAALELLKANYYFLSEELAKLA